MAERGSGSTPKRASRSRRRSAVSAVQERETLDVTPEAAEMPPQAAIEEAFEEAAAARQELEDLPPTEQDMDFESLEAPTSLTNRAAVPSPESSPSDDIPPGAGSEMPPTSGSGEAEDPMGAGESSETTESTGSRRRRRRRRRGRGGSESAQNGGGFSRPGQRYRGNGATAPQRPHVAPRPQQGGQPTGPRPAEGPGTPVMGVLELHPKGYGFLRDPKGGYFSQETDPFVSSSLIEKLGLREGVLITGEAVPGGRGQGPRLKQVDTVEGRTVEAYQQIRSFDELTPITPYQQIKLETGPTPITMRVMDLLTPIAKGQRALLVAPPRTGKTMLLQEIADAVSKNHPEIYLMVLLIDERPEEVTEMKRRVRGEVIASSLDRDVESHIRVSQLVFERAKRMTETGRDVFVLLDSITRTARAFNKWSNSGRTGTGGLDIRAMDIPKKLFGLARQFEEGGSLTVVGTALIDTGSRMDEAIFQEFKGTGNMEMVLSRDLADRRIWPAIDITKSGTRREEKILSPETLEAVTTLRRSLISMSPVEAMEQLIRTLAKFPTNAEFLQRVRSVL